jgi:hypothetical protein
VQQVPGAVRLGPVEHVADERVPGAREVHADLVPAAALGLDLDERGSWARQASTTTLGGALPSTSAT